MILRRVRLLLFPELGRFESTNQQRDAWNRAELAVMRRYWIVGILATVAIFWLLVGDVTDRLPNSIGVVIRASLIVLSALIWTVLALAFRKTVQRSLREQLADHGIPICIKCGYDLRGSKERCPECGEAFESP